MAIVGGWPEPGASSTMWAGASFGSRVALISCTRSGPGAPRHSQARTPPAQHDRRAAVAREAGDAARAGGVATGVERRDQQLRAPRDDQGLALHRDPRDPARNPQRRGRRVVPDERQRGGGCQDPGAQHARSVGRCEDHTRRVVFRPGRAILRSAGEGVSLNGHHSSGRWGRNPRPGGAGPSGRKDAPAEHPTFSRGAPAEEHQSQPATHPQGRRAFACLPGGVPPPVSLDRRSHHPHVHRHHPRQNLAAGRGSDRPPPGDRRRARRRLPVHRRDPGRWS